MSLGDVIQPGDAVALTLPTAGGGLTHCRTGAAKREGESGRLSADWKGRRQTRKAGGWAQPRARGRSSDLARKLRRAEVRLEPRSCKFRAAKVALPLATQDHHGVKRHKRHRLGGGTEAPS